MVEQRDGLDVEFVKAPCVVEPAAESAIDRNLEMNTLIFGRCLFGIEDPLSVPGVKKVLLSQLGASGREGQTFPNWSSVDGQKEERLEKRATRGPGIHISVSGYISLKVFKKI